MLTEKDIFDISVETTVEAITNFATSSLNKKAAFQILDLIMPRERKIRSIVGGLETSMGTTFWEPLAKKLSKANGFVIHEGTEIVKPTKSPDSITKVINEVLEDREHQRGGFSAEESKAEIQNACQIYSTNPNTEWENPPRGHGVDIWISKDGVDYLFDTKTVQPNVGSFQRYLKQIIYWYSYFFARYPNASLNAMIVFPYNPFYPNNFWDRVVANAKPLVPGKEALVENEFWNFCTGYENSFEAIRKALEHVGENKLVSKQLDVLFTNLE
jgi:hypothetical protein